MDLYKLLLIQIVYFIGDTYQYPQNNNIHEISIENAPFMASIKQSGCHVCGAAIINERFVLTASNCINPSLQYYVRVGTNSIEYNGRQFQIKSRYNYEENELYAHKICLLELAKPLTYGPTVQNISLPYPNESTKDGTMGNVTGWGYMTSRGTENSDNLCQSLIQINARKKCSSGHLCAGGSNMNTCFGGQGGPLTVNDVLVGVLVDPKPYPLCKTEESLFANIAVFVNWIKKIINFN